MSLRNRLRLMVVDDMATSRALITQALDEIGFANYESENNGRTALARLEAAPAHLVLSDYNMPEMDGLELLKALRTSPSTQKIGFILVTGKPTPDMIQTARSLGLNNMIKKPFTAAALQQCIESAVGKI